MEEPVRDLSRDDIMIMEFIEHTPAMRAKTIAGLMLMKVDDINTRLNILKDKGLIRFGYHEYEKVREIKRWYASDFDPR